MFAPFEKTIAAKNTPADRKSKRSARIRDEDSIGVLGEFQDKVFGKEAPNGMDFNDHACHLSKKLVSLQTALLSFEVSISRINSAAWYMVVTNLFGICIWAE